MDSLVIIGTVIVCIVTYHLIHGCFSNVGDICDVGDNTCREKCECENYNNSNENSSDGCDSNDDDCNNCNSDINDDNCNNCNSDSNNCNNDSDNCNNSNVDCKKTNVDNGYNMSDLYDKLDTLH